ncbi:MAG: hypothetical protein ABL866_12090, partial [Devosia sp.]
MRRMAFLVFAGFLSFTTAEVFAGSSPNWPLNAFAWLLTVPLYGTHLLLLAHLAARTRRTSWSALYLFGVIFGFYETWITKVIWHGYFDVGAFAVGGIGPWFGLHETLGLALFYHPVTSFLLPLAILSRLFPTFGRHFPEPSWLFGSGRANRLGQIALIAVDGAGSGHNLADFPTLLITWLPTILLLWGGYLLLIRLGAAGTGESGERMATPILSLPEQIVTGAILLAIYLWSYGNLLSQNLPPPAIQVLTLGIYAAITAMIWALRASGPRDTPAAATLSGTGWIFPAVLAVALALLPLRIFAPALEQGIVAIAFLAMIPAGVALFLLLPTRS